MTAPAATLPGRRAAGERARLLLVASVVATAVLYAVPYGEVAAYPLVLLSTLAHELGHGLAAIAIGGRFEALRLWPDGSGAAAWSAATGRLGLAAVAAGGLLGPAGAAAILFAAGRRPRPSRWLLGGLAAGLAAAEVLVVRTLFGWLFVALVTALLALLALRAGERVAQTAVLFLGVQLALAVFSRGDYLFTAVAQTAAGPAPSDVAVIASALLLPYWFWGALCAAASLAILAAGLLPLLHPAEPNA